MIDAREVIDPRLRADIKRAESCKLVSYRDTKGVLTIGWGHELEDQAESAGVRVWTQEQADAQLDRDIGVAQTKAKYIKEWPSLDTDARQNAVLELLFNMGLRFLEFKSTLAAIGAKNWKGAHDGLLNSEWAAEVHATRADRIADYLLTGQYPEIQPT